MLPGAYYESPAPSIPSQGRRGPEPYWMAVKHKKTRQPRAASTHRHEQRKDNSRNRNPPSHVRIPYPRLCYSVSLRLATSERVPPCATVVARETQIWPARYNHRFVHRYIVPGALHSTPSVATNRAHAAKLHQCTSVSSVGRVIA